MSAPAAAAREEPSAAAVRAAGWVVLSIDGLRLALPQRDVRLIQLVADLKLSAAGEGHEVGWLLREAGDSWPAYCLDGALRLQRPAPDARRVCVFCEAEGAVLGIVCDRLWSLATDAELAVEPVPGCMTGAPTPVVGFARYQEGIAIVLGTTALVRYLSFLRDSGHGAHE